MLWILIGAGLVVIVVVAVRLLRPPRGYIPDACLPPANPNVTGGSKITFKVTGTAGDMDDTLFAKDDNSAFTDLQPSYTVPAGMGTLAKPFLITATLKAQANGSAVIEVWTTSSTHITSNPALNVTPQAPGSTGVDEAETAQT